ncbi:hypothetical protein J437_LFUL004794 [Ladona fulva]|uniref:Chromo domain-containing protein n=1 Tax=Ladona fulva TaxID=123851 RepID=A0A8K0K0A4_LADFU|nr:hypothetical protein J437_LFUL004794 [Ladona fulva]
MAGNLSSPANINKNPSSIKAAQKEMARLDVLVCGICHSVFHILEEFSEHKAKKECDQSRRIGARVESTATVWAYLLWKSNYLEELKSKGGQCKLSSWEIYQIWHNSPIESRNAWIKAGKAMQASQIIGKGVLQEVPKQDSKTSPSFPGGAKKDERVHIVINTQGNSGEQKGKVSLNMDSPKGSKKVDDKDQSSVDIAKLVRKSPGDNKSAVSKKNFGPRENEKARKTLVVKEGDKGKSVSPYSETLKRKEGVDNLEFRQLGLAVKATGRPKGVSQKGSPDEDEYAVEKILAKRFNHRWKRHEYWIKWEGYSMKEMEREMNEKMELKEEDEIKTENIEMEDVDVKKELVDEVQKDSKSEDESGAKEEDSMETKTEKPPSDEEKTPVQKSNRGRKLGSKNKVVHVDITPSSSSRPSRNSKEKALSQVKLWCGLKKSSDFEETPQRKRRVMSRYDDDYDDEVIGRSSAKKVKGESSESMSQKDLKSYSAKKPAKDEVRLVSFSKLANPERLQKKQEGDELRKTASAKAAKQASIAKLVAKQSSLKMDEIGKKAEEMKKEREVAMGSAEKAIALLRELTVDRPDWDEMLDGKSDSELKKDEGEGEDGGKGLSDDMIDIKEEPMDEVTVEPTVVVAPCRSEKKSENDDEKVDESSKSPVRDVKERTFTLLLDSNSPKKAGDTPEKAGATAVETAAGASSGKKKEVFILPKLREVLKDAKLAEKGDSSKNLVVGKQRGSLARLMMPGAESASDSPRKKPPNILSSSQSGKTSKPSTHVIVKSPQPRFVPIMPSPELSAASAKSAGSTPVTKTFITRNPIQVSEKDRDVKYNAVKVVPSGKGRVQVVGQVGADGTQLSMIRSVQSIRPRPNISRCKPLVVKRIVNKVNSVPNASSGQSPNHVTCVTPTLNKERKLSDSLSTSSSESEDDPFQNLPPLDEITAPSSESPPPPLTLCPLTGMLLDDDGNPLPPPVEEKPPEDALNENSDKDTTALDILKEGNILQSQGSVVKVTVVSEDGTEARVITEPVNVSSEETTMSAGDTTGASNLEESLSAEVGFPVATIEVGGLNDDTKKEEIILEDAVRKTPLQITVGEKVDEKSGMIQLAMQGDGEESIIPVHCTVGDGVTQIISVDTENGGEPTAIFVKQDGEESVANVDDVATVENINAGESRRVILLLPDGQMVLTEVNEQQFASLDITK